MAVVRALSDPDDAIFSNHRNHGHFLTYTGNFRGLIEEIMGREGGICGGRGGSQHLAYRNFHSDGVQAGLTAIGVGQALARKRRNSSGIVVVIVGDGTMGEGLLYESLNMASIWELPVLFVVENNRIAQTTPTALTTGGCIGARGAAFGLRLWRLNDADENFFQRAESVVEEVRQMRRAGFLVIDCMRLGPHSKGDDLRDERELRVIRDRDPLERLGSGLAPHVRREIDAANQLFMADVLEVAQQSPAAKFATTPTTLFARGSGSQSSISITPGPSQFAAAGNVRLALNTALRTMLSEHPEVVLLGEDMHDPYGGAFKVTAGLSTGFPDRVISTPLSEAGIIGAGIGLALEGARPIVEMMFADFLTLGIDQILNHAVKFPGMFPNCQVPLVIRTPSGGRRGYGPTHSQSPENIMLAVPGLTVVFGSHRHAVGELLCRAVLDWPYPTIFFEHKLLYAMEMSRLGYHELPANPSDPAAALFPTLVRGSQDPDVTIVAYGGMAPWAEKAATLLEQEELEVEIVLPSLLSPLPKNTLLEALSMRSKIAIVEEAHAGFGFGAELGALLLESGFAGRFTRIATPPVPIPAARSLEQEVIPGEKQIVNGILKLFESYAIPSVRSSHQ